MDQGFVVVTSQIIIDWPKSVSKGSDFTVEVTKKVANWLAILVWSCRRAGAQMISGKILVIQQSDRQEKHWEVAGLHAHVLHRHGGDVSVWLLGFFVSTAGDFTRTTRVACW